MQDKHSRSRRLLPEVEQQRPKSSSLLCFAMEPLMDSGKAALLSTCAFSSSEEPSGVDSLAWLRKRCETIQVSLLEGLNQNTQQNSAARLTLASYPSCRGHEDQPRCPYLPAKVLDLPGEGNSTSLIPLPS